VAYGYDALYRLTKETIANASTGPNGQASYSYDPVGNRLTRLSTIGQIPSASYAYDANDRLLSDLYDADGNTIQSAGKQDRYDFEDRLVQRHESAASQPSAIDILYDGYGNRVGESVTVGGITTVTAYLVDDRI